MPVHVNGQWLQRSVEGQCNKHCDEDHVQCCKLDAEIQNTHLDHLFLSEKNNGWKVRRNPTSMYALLARSCSILSCTYQRSSCLAFLSCLDFVLSYLVLSSVYFALFFCLLCFGLLCVVLLRFCLVLFCFVLSCVLLCCFF